MLADILIKLLRKRMPLGLYRRLAGGFLGRKRAYHRPETYAEIFRHYRENGLRFDGRLVIEVGPGNQFFTALLFLAEGAREVLVVDPVADASALGPHIRIFADLFGRPLPADAAARIRIFRDIAEVPAGYDAAADVICSNHVLEHLPEVEGFFAQNRRLLAPRGVAYHRVDLSDHTYHVFDRFPFTRSISPSRSLYHLRYSPRTFERLNDRKCYMNRILLPDYLAAAGRQGLRIGELKRIDYRPVPIHPDLVARAPGAQPADFFVTGFSLKLGA